MSERNPYTVPRLDHETQFVTPHAAIMAFVNGEIDYFNVSAITHKERVNVFFVKRKENNKFDIGTFGGDVIEDHQADGFIEYNQVKVMTWLFIDEFEDRRGLRTPDTNFSYVGGKNQ